MSMTRNELPQYIDNLEALATRLIDFTADKQNGKTMLSLMEREFDEYKKPLESWLYAPFYIWFRKRVKEIKESLKMIETIIHEFKDDDLDAELDYKKKILKEVEKIFAVDKGEWKSSSVNTNFMSSFIKKLPGYETSTFLKENEIVRLNEIFLREIPEYIHACIVDTQKKKREEELKKVRAQKITKNKPADVVKSEVGHKECFTPQKLKTHPIFVAVQKDLEGFFTRKKIEKEFEDDLVDVNVEIKNSFHQTKISSYTPIPREERITAQMMAERKKQISGQLALCFFMGVKAQKIRFLNEEEKQDAKERFSSARDQLSVFFHADQKQKKSVLHPELKRILL